MPQTREPPPCNKDSAQPKIKITIITKVRERKEQPPSLDTNEPSPGQQLIKYFLVIDGWRPYQQEDPITTYFYLNSCSSNSWPSAVTCEWISLTAVSWEMSRGLAYMAEDKGQWAPRRAPQDGCPGSGQSRPERGVKTSPISNTTAQRNHSFSYCLPVPQARFGFCMSVSVEFQQKQTRAPHPVTPHTGDA